jgi:hypothetical protein
MLASCPASTLNQKIPDSGIPLDSIQIHLALADVSLLRSTVDPIMVEVSRPRFAAMAFEGAPNVARTFRRS